MRRLPPLSVAFLSLLALPNLAAAQDHPTTAPAETPEGEAHDQLINELFVGEKIYIQDKGEWVISLTPWFSRAKDAKEFEFATEVKYGVTDRLQLSLELPFSQVIPDMGHQTQGLGDISLAANYNFLQLENFSAGVRSEFLLPTGSQHRDLGEGEFVWAPSLLTATRVGKGEIYLGVGGEIGDDHDAFTYSAAGAYPWGDFVGVLELTGAAGGRVDELYLAPGAYWHPAKNMEFGLGVPIGLTHGSDNWRIVLKFVFEF